MAVSKGSEDILDDDYDALPSPVCPQPKEKKKLLTRFLQGRAKPEELQAKNILHGMLLPNLIKRFLIENLFYSSVGCVGKANSRAHKSNSGYEKSLAGEAPQCKA